MAPSKNKKKVGGASKSASKVSAASKSESKDGVSGRKRLRKGLKTAPVSKTSSEEPVSDNKLTEDKKEDGDAAKESVPTPKVKKPCTWLKLDRLNPPTTSKSTLESCKEGKEAQKTTQVEASKDNKRKRNEKVEEKGHCDPEMQIDSRPEKKEKDIINDRHEDAKRDEEESKKNPGGLIFMCNAKTKPDCFRYQLMGVPGSKKEVVMNIKPGLKMFLYDYDLKLMYGVFEASSAGGMKLEPAAFGGAFPAQVRFSVYKDCLPLTESVFKKAIKDSYDERTRKFKTELTVKQVKNLINLFRPIPRNLNHSDTRGKSIHSHHENQFPDFHNSVRQDPLFLTEQEYRNNGLQQGRPLLPTTAGDRVGHSWEPKNLDVELKNLLRNPDSTTDPAVRQREVNRGDAYFPSEKEYHTYGLRGPHQAPNAVPPIITNNSVARDSSMDAYDDPYGESTTELVNRYLSIPITTASAEPYPLFGRERYVNDHPARIIPDGERASASYNLHEHSRLDQRSYSLNAPPEPSKLDRGASIQRETVLTSAPVSSRYSFVGPPLSQHR